MYETPTKLLPESAFVDLAGSLIRYNVYGEIPDYVKQASMTPKGEDSSLKLKIPLQSYGDPLNRLYPCHTKAAAWLSAVSLHYQKPNILPERFDWLQENVQKKLAFFNVDNPISSVESQTQKEASEINEEDYAWVCEKEGQPRGYLPLTDNDSVVEAVDYLKNNRDSIPLKYRRKIAKAIANRVDEFGEKLSDDDRDLLMKQAGYGMPRYDLMGQIKIDREPFIRTTQQLEVLEKIAGVVSDLSSKEAAKGKKKKTDLELLNEIEEKLDQFDEITGVKKSYDTSVCRPEDIFHGVTYEKAASTLATVCELSNGIVFEKSAFEGISPGKVQSNFGDDFLNRVTIGLKIDGERFAKAAESLPAREADRLVRVLEESQIPSIAKFNQPKFASYSTSELSKLADSY